MWYHSVMNTSTKSAFAHESSKHVQVQCTRLMSDFIDYVVSNEGMATRAQLLRAVLANTIPEDNEDLIHKVRKEKRGH